MVAVGLVAAVRMVRRALAGALLLIAASSPFGAAAQDAATTLTGIVTRVSDGDTLWLRPQAEASRRRPVKLRLLGIDAPERCQSGGAASTAALRSRVLHRTVVVQVAGKDSYGRWLGNLLLHGDDVGAWMVREGQAWSYRHQGTDAYAAEEREARAARRGVFGDPGAIEPRAFRRRHGACD